MDDVDGLGETGGTAGVGQDVDSTSLRLTPYGFDATSLVELHQIAGTTVKVSPACIILELARMASTAGHGCIFFMAKDVMAAIQLQLVSQSHVGLHFDSRGLGRHAQFHKVYFLRIASSAPGCVHRLVEKLIEYDIQALYTNRRKALLTARDLLFADVIPPADLSSRLRPFSLHPDSGEVVFDKEPSTAVDGRPPSHLPSTANSGGPLSPSAASSTDRSGLPRSNTGNDNSVHLPTAQVEKSSAVAPSKSATADNDRDGGAANTRDLPSGATSKSKDRGGAGTTRDGGGAAGMTNDQAGAANTQTDNTNLRPPISPPAVKPPSVISGGSPLRQDLSTAASEARSISTEIAAAVLANLQSLAAPPSVTDELVTVVRQLKRKVDDLTERSEKLEALVVGGAAPRKKRAVKGKPNKAQLIPAAGKENGGAGPQKSPGKERAYGEGEEGEETRQPLAKKLRAEEPSPSGKGKDGKKKRGPLGYVNPNYAENGPGAKPVKPHTKPNEGPAATAPRADQIKDGSVAS